MNLAHHLSAVEAIMDAEHISKCLGELLPHTVDRLARETPSTPYGRWPVAQASYEDGFSTIDYDQLANSVNGLAWWIRDKIGTSQKEEKVLAYVGPNDVRFTALLLAAVKAGCVVRSYLNLISSCLLVLLGSQSTDTVGPVVSYFATEQRSGSAVTVHGAEVPDAVDKRADATGRACDPRECRTAPEPFPHSGH